MTKFESKENAKKQRQLGLVQTNKRMVQRWLSLSQKKTG